MNDLTGTQFSSWTVLGYSHKVGYNKFWKCKCVCGAEFSITQGSLTSGRSKSCRLCNAKRTSASNILRNKAMATHRQCHTKLYSRWRGILSRVKYKPHYTKLGVKVCQEWQDSFEAFRDWALKNGYRDTLTIDRFPDKLGDYSPDNCRWVPNIVQQYNKQYNLLTSYGCAARLVARDNGITDHAFDKRIRMGWSPNRASSEPMRKNVNGKYLK